MKLFRPFRLALLALLLILLLLIIFVLRHADEKVLKNFDTCVAPPAEVRETECAADFGPMHLWCVGIDGPKTPFWMLREGRPKAGEIKSFEDLAKMWEHPREIRHTSAEWMPWRIYKFESRVEFCKPEGYDEKNKAKQPFVFVHTLASPDVEREWMVLLTALAVVLIFILCVGIVLNRLLAAEILFDRHTHKDSRYFLSRAISAAFQDSVTLKEARDRIRRVLEINKDAFSDEGGDSLDIIEPWDLFADLKGLYRRQGLTIETECPDWLEIEVWPKSFLRAVHNGMQNASDAPGCDRIRLLARREHGAWVTFIIENNGEQIPEKIVERFNRRRPYPAPRRTGRQRAGLRIILRTAQKHRGMATLENLAPFDPRGMSVRLAFRLPAEQPKGTTGLMRWIRRMLSANSAEQNGRPS